MSNQILNHLQYKDFEEELELVKKYGGVPITKPEVIEGTRYCRIRVPQKVLKAEHNYWTRLTRIRVEDMEG